MKSPFRPLLFLVSSLVALSTTAAADFDLCIYGGTPAGIAAGVQARRMGKSVILLEPTAHLGGMSTGGLSATDIGNKAAIGGIAREFYGRIAQHYSQDAAWTRETRQAYFARHGSGQSQASDLSSSNATMWTFEPHVAEEVFNALVREHGVVVRLKQRLAKVEKNGPRLVSLTTDGGEVVRARMFIDATYEGDLMAMAGVAYTVGREANAQYGETLNGVRGETPKHQFTVAVDPYRKPGDPSSGLLPFITSSAATEAAGHGDRRVQTYNFRLCFTTNAANRLPLTSPPNYDPAQYELLARYLEALVAAGQAPKLEEFWNPIWMPNGKTDINNNGAISTDFIGANYDYPEGSLAQRARIWTEHENYTRGFLTFLATSPRVPAHMRAEMQLWGPCKDEFVDTGGWPRQLYIREARRMVSSYVMTEHNCRGQVRAEDPVGLGAYNMDSHNCQRWVRAGHVENEGDVQVGVKPYPISYRSIVAIQSECENLAVPVCLSATHIAYGSIRMEPVFMILGQSAATATCLALDRHVALQTLPYEALRARLLSDHQVLEWRP